MSDSKFGQPMPIQQPPPICKKGPPNLPIPPPGPPHDLQAAVDYKPPPGTEMGPGYSGIVPISLGNPTKVYKGEATSGSVKAIVKVQMFTEIRTWDATVDFEIPDAPNVGALFGVRPYQDVPILFFPKATTLTFPDGGFATIKLMP